MDNARETYLVFRVRKQQTFSTDPRFSTESVAQHLSDTLVSIKDNGGHYALEAKTTGTAAQGHSRHSQARTRGTPASACLLPWFF